MKKGSKRDMDKVIVYGAGKMLETLQDTLYWQYIKLIVDGDEKKCNHMIGGIPIYTKDILCSLPEKSEIVISSDKYFDEIKKDILKINDTLQCITLNSFMQNVSKEIPPIGYCFICERDIFSWTKIGQDNHTKYHIIGNGLRQSRCPYCGSIDRHRWNLYVLENCIDIFHKKCKVLHFAPENRIERKFRNCSNITYLTADIQEGRADCVCDMTKMQFPDHSFDYIIANHVLEHIKDEKAAILELKRCIKPDGAIILSFPITMEINTLEDDSYVTEEDRKKYYGQADHVRLYGRDFQQRLEQYGLIVETYTPKNLLSEEEIRMSCLIKDDIAIVCKIK